MVKAPEASLGTFDFSVAQIDLRSVGLASVGWHTGICGSQAAAWVLSEHGTLGFSVH